MSKVLPAVWRDAVCDSRGELPPAAKLVAYSVARHMNRDGLAYPSVELLAEETGYDVRLVRRMLRVLREAGFLDFPDNKGGRGKANRYQARLPDSAAAERHSEWGRAAEERELTAAERADYEYLCALRDDVSDWRPESHTPEWREEYARREAERAAFNARWDAEKNADGGEEEEEAREELHAAQLARWEAVKETIQHAGDRDGRVHPPCPHCNVIGGYHKIDCPAVRGEAETAGDNGEPERSSRPSRKVCRECGTGGGHHTDDCPTVADGEAA